MEVISILVNFGTILAGLSGGGVVFWKFIKPHIINEMRSGLMCETHNAEFIRLHEDLMDLNLKKQNDYKTLQKLSGENRAQMKALNALLAHAETNNATGEMKAAREMLLAFIIEN